MRYVTGLDNWDAYGQKQYLASISLRGENQAADLELAWRSLTGNGTLPDAGVRSLAGSYQTTAGDFNLRVRGKIQELSRTGVNSVTGTDYGHQIGFEISRSMGNMTATYRWQREGLIAGYLGSWQRLLLERPLTANLKLAAGIRQDELINDGKLTGCLVWITRLRRDLNWNTDGLRKMRGRRSASAVGRLGICRMTIFSAWGSKLLLGR